MDCSNLSSSSVSVRLRAAAVLCRDIVAVVVCHVFAGRPAVEETRSEIVSASGLPNPIITQLHGSSASSLLQYICSAFIYNPEFNRYLLNIYRLFSSIHVNSRADTSCRHH